MSLPVLSLQGKVALVTGASRGIGRAIGLILAEAGAEVVVCSRGLDSSLGEVAEEIRGFGRRSLAIPADVTQKAAVDNLIQRTMKEFGAIDILVNNAGTVIRGAVVDHSEAEWDKVMNINLKSYYLCSRAVAKIMMTQKRGNIINTASIRGLQAATGRVSYSVSKAGVIMLTRVLALELASDNIRVNAIAPGFIKTKLTEFLWSDPEASEKIEATIPMGRWGALSEIANVALFLASDASSYITGHTLVVDGGLVA